MNEKVFKLFPHVLFWLMVDLPIRLPTGRSLALLNPSGWRLSDHRRHHQILSKQKEVAIR